MGKRASVAIGLPRRSALAVGAGIVGHELSRIVDPKASGANGASKCGRIQFETSGDAVGVYFAKEPNRLEFGSLRP